MRRRGNQLLQKTTEAIPGRLDFFVRAFCFHIYLSPLVRSHNYTGIASMRLEGVFVGTIRVS